MKSNGESKIKSESRIITSGSQKLWVSRERNRDFFIPVFDVAWCCCILLFACNTSVLYPPLELEYSFCIFWYFLSVGFRLSLSLKKNRDSFSLVFYKHRL